MSVNGLIGMSSMARKKEKSSAPLKLQCERIHNVHVQRHQQANRAFVPAGARPSANFFYVKEHAHACIYHHAPQRRRSEAHRAADVHRVAEHVKRESLNAMVHQNAKIVPQERARYAERPRRAHDERLACGEEHCGQDRVERSGEQWHARLLEERAPVSGIGELELRREGKPGERGGREDVQMVAYDPRAENAHGEEVAA